MKLCLRIALLVACLVGWAVTQEGFDLSDAFDDDPKPTPKPPPEKPKVNADAGGGGGELDLSDAFGPDEPEPEKPKKPAAGDNDNDMGFDLADALGPDPNPKPDPPAVVPPKSGEGGGSFDDSDLMGVGEGDYKPDGGRGAGGRGAVDPADNAADQPQAEAGSGQIAGIASAIGVAILGAASSYFAYQKKKLCFKLQGGVDPESGKGHQGTQSDPQVMSNLLQSSS